MIIKKTLSETIDFLETMKAGIIKDSGLVQIKRALESALFMKVFVNNMNNVYSIENIDELKKLIEYKTEPRRGSYNHFYAIWKSIFAPFPHEVTGTMKSATTISIIGDYVDFRIPDIATTKKGFNYGPKHEKRKSILKATVFFAWGDIMNRIFNLYKRFIENA